MKTNLYNKQIIQQGGSYVITIPKDVGFKLNDVVDVTLKHVKATEAQSDLLLARLAGKKMKDMGVTKMTITLKDIEI